MQNSITINNQQLLVKEYQGKSVVTLNMCIWFTK